MQVQYKLIWHMLILYNTHLFYTIQHIKYNAKNKTPKNTIQKYNTKTFSFCILLELWLHVGGIFRWIRYITMKLILCIADLCNIVLHFKIWFQCNHIIFLFCNFCSSELINIVIRVLFSRWLTYFNPLFFVSSISR